MSFFDRFRAKWKHPDPAVREAAIAEISDQSVLERLAEHDTAERVRTAAVQALTDQNALARIALGETAMAVMAASRLRDRKLIAKVAHSAVVGGAREIAVERLDDGVALHRIFTSDTDARVRLKARTRLSGPDPVRDFIRTELSKLHPVAVEGNQGATFRGSLEEVSSHLIGDPRFRINGWLDHEIPGLAAVRRLGAAEHPAPDLAPAEPAPRAARFLAFKRDGAGEPEEAAASHVYFEITVRRIDAGAFETLVEEKSMKLVADAAEWSRVSNSSRQEVRLPTASPASRGER
ncbi:MAG: hypothetical protein JNL92_12130 [Opitutaceae bacterium]|nr:hypothetical protein [Opitutaceae bacterium]